MSLSEAPFEETATTLPKSNHIGLRIGIAVAKRNDSLVMKLNEIASQLESIVFENENFIDYIELVRVKAAGEETIIVEIVEKTDKPNPWVNE